MDWMSLLNQILDIILPAAASLVAIWFGILGNKLKTVYTEKINTETKKQIAQTTVEYVEQVYQDIHGEEKLTKAIEQASTILAEKGISVSDTELRTLLESAVYGLQAGWLDETYTITEDGQDALADDTQETTETEEA